MFLLSGFYEKMRLTLTDYFLFRNTTECTRMVHFLTFFRAASSYLEHFLSRQRRFDACRGNSLRVDGGGGVGSNPCFLALCNFLTEKN